MDDKEEFDHGVCLEDPNIIDYQKIGSILWVKGIGMLMHDAPVVILVIGL